MAQRLLGGLSPASFLRDHWQKQPLFVRNAIPQCGSWLQRETLFDLACRDDVESRIVTHAGNRWRVAHGPFTRHELRRLPARNWTLLMQGVEQLLPDAAAMLQQFSFIPHARLDDLMVSYAAPGGGVGPHFDSYDVFLLQGAGTRRWRISAQRDLTLLDNTPLRILKKFRPRRAWHVETGDLLYLPPRYAHDGVADTTCMTLSVGFRAPHKLELASSFLNFLQDNLKINGMIEDAGLPLQTHPARLPPFLISKFSRVLKRVRWNEADVRRFAGCYLTEPKPHVVFTRPRRALTLNNFVKRLMKHGIRLALPSRMLFEGRHVFINGECHPMSRSGRDALIRLADTREARAFVPNAETAQLTYAWYRAGYVYV